MTSKALAKAGDVFSLELPRRGIFLEQGDPFVALTTANGVLELVSPLKGYIVEVNWELEKTPELLASVCDSWIVIMIPTGG